MAAISNITVFDGAASPVSHTLVPVSVTRDKGKVTALWREAAINVPAYAQVWAQATIERNPSGVYKTEMRVGVPVMESISGQNAAGYTAAPKVAFTNTTILTGLYHERSDITGRRLCRQIAVNLGNNISTTVAAATSGPLPDLFDSLIAPT
jgi:hypothetical protein